MMNLTADFLHDFLRLFYLNICCGCGQPLVKGEDILCTLCIRNLPIIRHHLRSENFLAEKFIGRLPLKDAYSYLEFRKSGIVQGLLHQMKYSHRPRIGTKLGRIFGNELRKAEVHLEYDLIVPLPLHFLRMLKRGFNQSSKFAEGLSSSLNIPWSDKMIVRKKITQTQTKKSKTERWENVKDAFEIRAPQMVKGRRILLVDDIITTGSTIEACGQSLINSGCLELGIACIAEAQ